MKGIGLLILCLFAPLLAYSAETEAPAGADIMAVLLTCFPDSWGGRVTLAVTICAAVSAVWPRPSDDSNVFVRLLYGLVNAVGFNAGKAQNADDAAAKARKIRA